jgi:hypothetical protein
MSETNTQNNRIKTISNEDRRRIADKALNGSSVKQYQRN